ncbi:4Fe-4S binding protein [Desulfobotulus sp.]|uniref:4Fe-4S binding protein n=1 Tax=Desulfobotulus sp. TaxID=1940337 RepID=UPI002A36471F|nr:4Fe-4S binding protein [Desulfobotulus sp.]MDY0164683.1 4Fe-4S binding protein [Desulfobotulus sp.]
MAAISMYTYWFGQSPATLFSFLPKISIYIISIGILTTLLSIVFYRIQGKLILRQPTTHTQLKLRRLKLNRFEKRRMYFHGLIYLLITLHITLATLGIIDLKSICPRSWMSMMAKGVYGTAAIFFAFILLFVFIWGRGLCAWGCVFAPIQEQSTNLLKKCGMNPENKKFNPTPFLAITTGLMLARIIHSNYINFETISFNANAGYALDSVYYYWVFWGGVITFIPMVAFFTYYLGNRWFCKYICPLGGLQALYSKFSIIKIRIDKKKCISCNMCSKKCQMSIDIKKHLESPKSYINDSKCIVCGDCIDACHKKALYFGSVFSKNHKSETNNANFDTKVKPAA